MEEEDGGLVGGLGLRSWGPSEEIRRRLCVRVGDVDAVSHVCMGWRQRGCQGPMIEEPLLVKEQTAARGIRRRVLRTLIHTQRPARLPAPHAPHSPPHVPPTPQSAHAAGAASRHALVQQHAAEQQHLGIELAGK